MAIVTEEDMIKGVIDDMRAARTYAIDDITDNADGTWLVETLCTKDVVAGQYINIGSTQVRVTAVVLNTSFTVKTTTNIVAETTWTALAPYFFYGNPIDVSAEIDRKEDFQNKNYPAVVLFEIKDIERPGFESPVGSIPRVQLFFLDQYDPTNYTIEQTYTNVVDRMDALAMEFIRAIQNRRHFIANNEPYSLAKWSKWNVSVIRNGKNGSETIFNNNLSGVELNMRIPLSKNMNNFCNVC